MQTKSTYQEPTGNMLLTLLKSELILPKKYENWPKPSGTKLLFYISWAHSLPLSPSLVQFGAKSPCVGQAGSEPLLFKLPFPNHAPQPSNCVCMCVCVSHTQPDDQTKLSSKSWQSLYFNLPSTEITRINHCVQLHLLKVKKKKSSLAETETEKWKQLKAISTKLSSSYL